MIATKFCRETILRDMKLSRTWIHDKKPDNTGINYRLAFNAASSTGRRSLSAPLLLSLAAVIAASRSSLCLISPGMFSSGCLAALRQRAHCTGQWPAAASNGAGRDRITAVFRLIQGGCDLPGNVCQSADAGFTDSS
ncbi:hypothetical protein [Thauera butanivorans]|uniref:hypothetical protein n=1 Tax=Thauera butanivorans TaxID=86174 RepID=UPI001470E5A8|nr:hypothetical protein [Thauera butanivorans]